MARASIEITCSTPARGWTGDEDAPDAAPEGDEWAAISELYAAPIRAALASSETREAFLETAIDAGVDLDAVEDLALRAFRARVDGATGDD